MSDGTAPQMLAAVRVIGVEIIDGGKTLALNLEKADGGEIADRGRRSTLLHGYHYRHHSSV